MAAKPPLSTIAMKPASLLASRMPCFQTFSCAWAAERPKARRKAAASASVFLCTDESSRLRVCLLAEATHSAHSRASGNPELQSRPQQFASLGPRLREDERRRIANCATTPLIPAQAGIRSCSHGLSSLPPWVPAFAGTSGGRSELRHHSAHSRASGKSGVANHGLSSLPPWVPAFAGTSGGRSELEGRIGLKSGIRRRACGPGRRREKAAPASAAS